MRVKRSLSVVLAVLLTISLFGCGGYDLEDKTLNASILIFGCKKDMTIKKAIKSSYLVADYKFDYVAKEKNGSDERHIFQIGIKIDPKKTKKKNKNLEAKAYFLIRCDSFVDGSANIPVSEDMNLMGTVTVDGKTYSSNNIHPKRLFDILTLDDEFDVNKL